MQKRLENIRIAWQAFYQDILTSPLYLCLAVLVSIITLIFSIWIPNLGLIREIIFSSDFTLIGKLTFLWNSLGAITTNFAPLTAVITLVIAILFGFNIAITAYYFKKRIAFQKAGGMSLAGMLAGLIGIGCASCGSVILATFLGVGATTAVTGLLPFGGEEFAIIGIVILIWTIYVTAKKIVDPLACGIPLKKN